MGEITVIKLCQALGPRTTVAVSWQGIRHGSEAARSMLPRMLNLLSFENESGGVGAAVERGIREVPLWVWLPWLPQLLMSLQRPEASVIKQLLIHLAIAFPQACLGDLVLEQSGSNLLSGSCS